MADGKYFKKWQDVIAQFKKDLEGIELNQEQQDIYDVVLQQKDKIRLRINDLNELEDIFVNFGSRQKGIRKLISVHYAGLRNPVTAWEVLNIGDVIRRGKLTEEGNAEYPNSRRYELIASDGAALKVIIDFNRKKDKNRSVINFYSDRTDPRGQASSGGVTDLNDNISQNPENANPEDKNGLERTGTDGNGRVGRWCYVLSGKFRERGVQAAGQGDAETGRKLARSGWKRVCPDAAELEALRRSGWSYGGQEPTAINACKFGGRGRSSAGGKGT